MAGGSLISAMALVAILTGTGITDVAAQSCFNAAMTLTPCLNYITGSSNGSPSGNPSQECCDGVRTLLNGGIECFCTIITTSNPFGFINRTLALNIPGFCNIRTEPLNKCEENAGVPFLPTPASSPAPSPVDHLAPSPAASSPATADSPSADSSPVETPPADISPDSVPSSQAETPYAGISPDSVPSSQAETPYAGISPSSVPLSGGRETGGSSRPGTEFLLSVLGVLAGMIYVIFIS